MREYLRNLRNVKSLKQRDVAEHVGMTEGYYNLIENGKRIKSLDVGMLSKLAQTFDVTLEELAENERKYNDENIKH